MEEKNVNISKLLTELVWLIEPPKPEGVNIAISIEDKSKLTPQALSALNILMNELKIKDLMLMSAKPDPKCSTKGCQRVVCQLDGCQPFSRSPCFINITCRIAEL